MILRPEVQEFAEWVERQLREQEVKCLELGYTPPELVRASKHDSCATGISMAFTNPTGFEVLGKVSSTNVIAHEVYV